MILKYYGGNISIEKLNDICKITSDGISAYHIVKAASKLGLNACGMKCELKYLISEKITLPIIAHVTLNHSFLHYVVIYEINRKQKYLLIADPSSKIYKMSFNEFAYIYNENLITFNKQNIIYEEENININKIIYKIIKNNKLVIFQIIIFSSLFIFFSIITTYFIQMLINAIEHNSLKSYVVFLTTIFTIIYILKYISKYTKDIITTYLMQKIDFDLTTWTYHFILSLPYSYYQNRTTGEMISKLGDLNEIKNLINKSLEIIIYFFFSFISIIILFKIDIIYLYIIFLIHIIYIFILFYTVKAINEEIKKYQTNKSELTSFMVEGIASFETVKGLHIENELKNKLLNKILSYLLVEQKLKNKLSLITLLKEITEIIGFILLIIVSIKKLSALALLFTIIFLYNNSVLFIKLLIEFIPLLKETRETFNRLKYLFIKENKKEIIYKKLNGNIICKNLTYTYDDKENVLENISFMIEAKSKVMILGNSGIGKSTFFKILLKYYNINRNTIFIDNIDLCDYNEKIINQNIIYISQNEFLFTGTLYDNITLYKNIKEKDFIKVTKICELDKIIKNNSLGYFMLIEEGGRNLSGGEKQRIFLARALLRNFNILIIDEGLSQLDVKSERRILKSIFSNYRDKMIFFSSHRIDNLDLFDKIIRFESKNKIKDIERNQYGYFKETEYF